VLNFKKLFRHLNKDQREEGQGLVEYALILFLVAVVVIAILVLLGPQVGSVFSAVKKGIS
jgi:pilus assembly protein Flp/PilA